MRAGSGLVAAVGVAVCAAGCLPTLPDVPFPCAKWEEPGLYRVPIDEPQDGVRRPYVYVPGTEGPRDVVVLLHGGGMSGPKIDEVTEYQAKAEDEGFVLVYPNGLGWPLRHWNAGGPWDAGDETNDVKFLDDLVATVMPMVCGQNVLATGFSNGSMMVHRWACETKTAEIDAVGVSSGPLLTDRCDGAPLPIRHYHGLADPIVPVEGGAGQYGRVYPALEDAMVYWRQRNLCGDAPAESRTTGDTTCLSWPCAVPTEACLINKWGHMWPGGIHAAQTDADATDALWQFFLDNEPDGQADDPFDAADGD